MSKPSVSSNAAFSGLTVLKADLKKQAQLEKIKAEQRLADEQAAKIAAQDADAAALFKSAIQGTKQIIQESTRPKTTTAKLLKAKAASATVLARRAAAIGTEGGFGPGWWMPGAAEAGRQPTHGKSRTQRVRSPAPSA